MNIEDDSRLECFTRRKLIYVRIGKVSNFLIDLHLRRAEWNKERTRHKLKSLAKWKLLFNWMRREKTFLPARRTKQYFSKPLHMRIYRLFSSAKFPPNNLRWPGKKFNLLVIVWRFQCRFNWVKSASNLIETGLIGSSWLIWIARKSFYQRRKLIALRIVYAKINFKDESQMVPVTELVCKMFTAARVSTKKETSTSAKTFTKASFSRLMKSTRSSSDNRTDILRKALFVQNFHNLT